jgi:hypothetical protein
MLPPKGDTMIQINDNELKAMMDAGVNANLAAGLIQMSGEELLRVQKAVSILMGIRKPKTLSPVRFHDHISAARYNGGWCKTVTSLDKTKNNGYSIIGDFVKAELLQVQKPGLYLDCDIDGSRNHQKKNYTLFRYDGVNVEIITILENGGADWAIQLWPAIENALDAAGQVAE